MPVPALPYPTCIRIPSIRIGRDPRARLDNAHNIPPFPLGRPAAAAIRTHGLSPVGECAAFPETRAERGTADPGSCLAPARVTDAASLGHGRIKPSCPNSSDDGQLNPAADLDGAPGGLPVTFCQLIDACGHAGTARDRLSAFSTRKRERSGNESSACILRSRVGLGGGVCR